MAKIQVGFHGGNIMDYLSATYGRWDLVINELVQNMLDPDVGATHGVIVLDLKERCLTAYDNGGGASRGDMTTRINNIGSKIKKKGVGRKGIGNLALLSLRSPESTWSMTTHKIHGPEDARRWWICSLDAESMSKREVFFKDTSAPKGFKILDDTGNPTGMTTMVRMTKIEPSSLMVLRKTEDPVGMITESISETFSSYITTTKAKILVRVISEGGKETDRDVVPQRFPGQKQTIIEIGTPSGIVSFEFYTTKTSTKQSRIFVEHEGRVNFHLKNCKEIWDLVKPTFGSGFMQGIIRLSFGELDTNRSKLKYNTAFEHFSDAVLTFHDKHAEKWLKNIQDEQRTDRTADILKDVLDQIDPFLKEYPDLLSEVFKGSKGPTGRPIGNEGDLTMYEKAPAGSEKTKEGTSRQFHGKSAKRHTGEYIVAGRDVKIITDTGLTVRITEADPASPYGVKWRVRLGDEGRNKGAILINRSHNDFLDAERAGWSAERTYMLLLLLMSISLPLAETPERAEIFREEFEEKFLRFSKPLIPKIPSKAKKQVEDE